MQLTPDCRHVAFAAWPDTIIQRCVVRKERNLHG